MQLESAFEAKNTIFEKVFGFAGLPAAGLAGSADPQRTLWMDPGATTALKVGAIYRSGVMNIAVGIGASRRSLRNDAFSIVTYIQEKSLVSGDIVDRIERATASEVEIRYVGRIRRFGRPWHQDHCRPIKPGCSIGHFRVTAGTLGCFVRLASDNSLCALSNNHILAWSNRGKHGDAILQPGKDDGGKRSDDQIGTLHHIVDLKFGGAAINYVDCAVATLFPDVQRDPCNLAGLRRISGTITGLPEIGAPVYKIGRTTGLTEGRIAAIEVDQVIVAMESRGMAEIARFDGQISIEGSGSGSFSKGGDSGSVIVDSNGKAVGLLFAGTKEGGSNSRGITFANPIGDVEAALDATIFVD